MTAAAKTTQDELRMSAKEFDRIMRKALQVQPVEAKTKAKPRKKRVGHK